MHREHFAGEEICPEPKPQGRGLKALDWRKLRPVRSTGEEDARCILTSQLWS